MDHRRSGIVKVEQTYAASPQIVWRALTNHDDMKHWYFDIPQFKPEVGFEFTFTGGKDKERPYVHRCRILTIIPEKKLAYSWRYEGQPGSSLVTFELQPVGRKTKLTVTHEGLDTFPKNTSDFDESNFQEGWTAILGTSLKKFLEPA